jgi:hypothetical protein
MNTVTARLSLSTWGGLSALAMGVVLMFVCLFSVAMIACHPSLTAKPATTSVCNCRDTLLPVRPARNVWDYRGSEAPTTPINTDAASEKKYGNPCPTCPQVRRYPTYVQPSQPTYVQPTYVQPSQPTYVQPTYVQPYIQPTYVQPASPQPYVQPTAPKPVTPVNPSVVSVSNKCQLALFLDNGQQSAQIKNWFESDAKLVALRQKCTFEIYTPQNALYLSRYSKIVPVSQFPVVLFQNPDGGHIHAAGQATIPRTPAELYAHLQLGYKNAMSVKNAPVSNAGSEVMTRGYNFDTAIQSNEDCPDGNCPVNVGEDESRWRPGDRIRDLFPAVKDAREIMVWGGAAEIAVYVALAAFVCLGAATFLVVVMVIFVRMSRNQE